MGLYDNTDESAPSERRVRNVPWPDVEMDTLTTDADFVPGALWPALRVRRQREFYEMLHRVWRGDLSDFVGDRDAVRLFVNWCRRAGNVLAYLMTTSGPTDVLQAAATSAVVNDWVFGRCYGIREGMTFYSPHTSQVFMGDQDDIRYCDRFVSDTSDTETFDRLRIRHVRDGIVTTRVHRYIGPNQDDSPSASAAMIGDIISEEEIDGDWGFVDSVPNFDEHGVPSMLDLIPPSVGLALRYTGAERVLAANEAPTTVIPVEIADIPAAFAGDDNEAESLARLSRREAEEQAKLLRQHDTVMSTGGAKQGYVLEWTGNLDSSMQLMGELEQALRFLTGIPAGLLEGGSITSGAALREQHLMLWAQTLQLHKEHRAMWEALCGGDVGWDNPFDVPIGNAPEEPNELEGGM